MTDLKKMLLGVGSLSMAGSVTAQQAPASEKGEVPTPPNILFLVVDDLKALTETRSPERRHSTVSRRRG